MDHAVEGAATLSHWSCCACRVAVHCQTCVHAVHATHTPHYIRVARLTCRLLARPTHCLRATHIVRQPPTLSARHHSMHTDCRQACDACAPSRVKAGLPDMR